MHVSEPLRSALQSARHIAVLTGAGISAESGVPTFRSADGLWKSFKPEELATLDAFNRNPVLVTEWYNARRETISDVAPNDGHRALADMEQVVDSFTIITQNIDGLHQQAGSRNVIELHGNIHRNFCLQCRRIYAQDELDDIGMPPTCTCGGLIRPDVVWFGEMLPDEALAAAQEAVYSCDVFLSIGTSAVVYPAAAFPIAAGQAGAYVAEVNVEKTELSDRIDECITGKAGEVLPALVNVLR